MCAFVHTPRDTNTHTHKGSQGVAQTLALLQPGVGAHAYNLHPHKAEAGKSPVQSQPGYPAWYNKVRCELALRSTGLWGRFRKVTQMLERILSLSFTATENITTFVEEYCSCCVKWYMSVIPAPEVWDRRMTRSRPAMLCSKTLLFILLKIQTCDFF